MTTRFRAALTLVALAGLSFALEIQAAAMARKRGESEKADHAAMSYCELLRHPKEYDGKDVVVRASYRYGFEWQEMFCLDCRRLGKTWLEFE